MYQKLTIALMYFEVPMHHCLIIIISIVTTAWTLN